MGALASSLPVRVRRPRLSAFAVVNGAVLSLVAAVCLFPMIHMVAVSFSTRALVLAGEVVFWPRGFNTASYAWVLLQGGFWTSLWVSAQRMVAGIAINVVLVLLLAFPLSKEKHEFRARALYVWFFFFTMLFEGGLIPLYMTVSTLGMLDTIWALVLPTAVVTYYMIIMRTFFQNIPEELNDSAYLDGANDIQIFLRIVLPISTPILATMTLFYAVQHWNSFFHALIFLTEKRLYPLQLILRSVVVEATFEQMNDIGAATDFMVLEKTIRFSVIMVSTLPILLVYPFLQKYFVKGVMLGSLKG
jgi:putative aldouronate transport system permease protein